jgi:hypothetical protein
VREAVTYRNEKSYLKLSSLALLADIISEKERKNGSTHERVRERARDENE